MALPALQRGPVLVRILHWNDAKSWTANVTHTRGMLVDILRGSASISNLEAKRMTKLLLSKELHELVLEDGASCESFCHALRSIGAEVEAVPFKAKLKRRDG